MSVFDFEGNIRDYSKKNAYWLGKASQIAYKPSGEAKSDTGIWGLNEFEYFEHRDTKGFLAGNKEVLFLVFRGTENLCDWMTDLDIDLVGGPGGKVHDGFLNALGYVWRDIGNLFELNANIVPFGLPGIVLVPHLQHWQLRN